MCANVYVSIKSFIASIKGWVTGEKNSPLRKQGQWEHLSFTVAIERQYKHENLILISYKPYINFVDYSSKNVREILEITSVINEKVSPGFYGYIEGRRTEYWEVNYQNRPISKDNYCSTKDSSYSM